MKPRKVTIVLDSNDDAFIRDFEGEVVQILGDVTEKLKYHSGVWDGGTAKLYDSNGNAVGFLKVGGF